MTIRNLSYLSLAIVLAVLLAVPCAAAANPAAVATSAVPGWLQVNGDGFGDGGNSAVSALAPFGGRLYAATYNSAGAQLWRTDGAGWSSVMAGGFGDATNTGIDCLFEFKGNLYAGTWNETSSAPFTAGAQLWRTANGTGWSRVTINGLSATQGEIMCLANFGNTLYGATVCYQEGQGGELWRSTTGDSGNWARCVSNGFGEANNAVLQTLAVYGGKLYAGTANWTAGGQVWRSSNGSSGWSKVANNGFGDAGNQGVSALAAFNAYLYASTTHAQGAGAEVWRCQACDGTDWTRVADNGLGNADNRGMNALEVYNGQLYLVVGNAATGLEVWRTANGTQWTRLAQAGFGDSKNRAPAWDGGLTVANNHLYVGTWNYNSGGELWMYLPKALYLPMAKKVAH